MSQKITRIFDNIGFNFIVENNNIKPISSIKNYNLLDSSHVGYYIPYIARNNTNKFFEIGIGEVSFGNDSSIIIKRINIVTSSNNGDSVTFPSLNNEFYIFANQSSFDSKFNNTVVIDYDTKLDPISALYLVDCSRNDMTVTLPNLSVSKNLIIEFKVMEATNHLTIRDSDGSVVSVLDNSNNYARLASTGQDWVILTRTNSQDTSLLSLADNNIVNTLSDSSGDEYSLQYKLGTGFSASNAYWEPTKKSILLGDESEAEANSIIPTSGNNNFLLNKKTYGSDFIVYGSGTINKNIFFSYDGKLGINIPSGSRPATLLHVVNDVCQNCVETVRIENRSPIYPTNLTLYYKPSTAIVNNSKISQINLSAKNTSGNPISYGSIEARAVDTSYRSEKGGLDLVVVSGATGVKTFQSSIDATYVGYSDNRVQLNNNGSLLLVNGSSQISVNPASAIVLSASTVTATGTSLLNTISSQNITASNLFINNLSYSGLLMISGGKVVNSPININALGSINIPVPSNKLLSTTSNGSITGIYSLDDYFLTERDIVWTKYAPRPAEVCLRQVTFSVPVPVEEFDVGDQVVIASSGSNFYRQVASVELNGNTIAGLLVDQNITENSTSSINIYSITKGGYLTITKDVDDGTISDSTENILSIRPLKDTIFNSKQKDINFIVYGLDENPALLIRANSGRILKPSGIFSPFATSRRDMFPIVVTSGGSGISNYYSSANYNYDISRNLFSGLLSDVGSNGMPSHYGTYDQNGNAAEWIEKPFVIESKDLTEFVAGGSYSTTDVQSIGSSGLKSIESLVRVSGYNHVGFRIAGLQGLIDLGAVVSQDQLGLSFVTVGDPQNIKDSTTTYIKNPEGSTETYSSVIINNLGVVNNFYRMSKHEITNKQYCRFLNATAKSKVVDRKLYDTRMASTNAGGILRYDTGLYEYVTKPYMENKPVVFVSYINAIKFINWVHHGAQTSITESNIDYIINNGAYNIYYIDENTYNIVKTSYRKYWLPDINEWHKSAYYRPANANQADGTSSVSIKRSEPYLVGSGIDITTQEEVKVFANLSVSGWIYADHIMIGDGTIMSSLSSLNFTEGNGATTQTTTTTTIPKVNLDDQWNNRNSKSILGSIVSCINCSFNGLPLRLDEDTDCNVQTNIPWWCGGDSASPGWFN